MNALPTCQLINYEDIAVQIKTFKVTFLNAFKFANTQREKIEHFLLELP